MADDPATTVDEAHLFEPHYDLHVWLYRENPRGMVAQFNPNAHVHEPQGQRALALTCATACVGGSRCGR